MYTTRLWIILLPRNNASTVYITAEVADV